MATKLTDSARQHWTLTDNTWEDEITEDKWAFRLAPLLTALGVVESHNYARVKEAVLTHLAAPLAVRPKNYQVDMVYKM